MVKRKTCSFVWRIWKWKERGQMFWTSGGGLWIFTQDKGGEIKSKQPSKIFPTLILFLRVVEPKEGKSWSNRNRNDYRHVQATGDCCWEIEDNYGDYEIVDPANPIIDTTNFDIATVHVYNYGCPP